jgi:hypothetical protein
MCSLKIIRRKRAVTVGVMWTPEELAKLDLLLAKYPETKVQSHRHQQIADELGSRNVKQVASKLQKYMRKGLISRPGSSAPFVSSLESNYCIGYVWR